MNNTLLNAIRKKNNRRGAYAVMCGIGVVMMLSKVSSGYAMYYYTVLFDKFFYEIQAFFVSAIKLLFGASTTQSLVLSKKLLTSNALSTVVTMVVQLITLFFPAYILSRICNNNISSCFEVKGRLAPKFVSFYFMVSLFMTSGAGIANVFYDFIFPKGAGGMPSVSVGAPGQYDAITLFLTLLNTAIFVPILEEYVFRGVFLKILRPYGTDFAVVASAFAFGVMHFNAAQSMYAFCFGIFSAMAVVVTGNIKTSVLFHILNNLFTMISEIMMLQSLKAARIYSNVILILTVIFGFWGIWQFLSSNGMLKKYIEAKNTQDYDTCVPSDKCGLVQLFTFPVIMFLLYYALSVFVPVI